MSDDMQFCPKCGDAVKNTIAAVSKERHGFTSFFLIMGVIFCSIGFLFHLFSFDTMRRFYYSAGYRLSSGFIILSGIFMAVYAITYILLLCWKKLGFWLYAVGSVAGSFCFISMGMNFFTMLFSSAVSIAILWGILHIRKNGYSAWDHMNENYNLKNNDNTNKPDSTYLERNCEKCGKVIPSGYSGCPNCGYSDSSTGSNIDLGKIPELTQSKETVIFCPYCKRENILKESFASFKAINCIGCNEKIYINFR
jgi:RNA polymerase subunit RPABC4/transcription elongation factor Spt4